MRTCPVAASVVLPRWRELTALSQIPLPDLKAHFEAGERERNGKKGGEKKRD